MPYSFYKQYMTMFSEYLKSKLFTKGFSGRE